jgi:hypothetical protein
MIEIMLRLTPLVTLVLAGAIGCIDRTRVNTQCEWSQDTLGALLMSDPQHGRHLVQDIDLATELAVRYADSINEARSGYGGHGGYIEGGRLRDRCMASLLSEVAAQHEVALEVVKKVRARGDRPFEWDAMVILLFGVIYTSVSAVITRSLSRRFSVDEGGAALAASVTAAFGTSALGLVLFQWWAMILEMIRVGNDHLKGIDDTPSAGLPIRMLSTRLRDITLMRLRSTGDTTNAGVNDPVVALWGHRQGRTAGALTPALVLRLRHRRR